MTEPCIKRIMKATTVIGAAMAVALVAGCGYRFSGGPNDSPFPGNVKTVVLESAINNTTITGIETELTNDLRREFALGTGLKPVGSGGDAVLKTIISSYEDTTTMYRADGKELTKIGTLRVACSLGKAGTNEVLWHKRLSSSHAYTVTDTITGTLANRRRAISRMIKDIIPRIHRSMYDNF
ncbi:MAG: LptE family protein [Desulfomonilaceae bacterium]|nr:LptE family protein [Desulfomonilaceae bacterium]